MIKNRNDYGMYLHKLDLSSGTHDDLGRKYSMWNLQDKKDLIQWFLDNGFKMEIISEWQEQGIRKAWFKKGMVQFNIDHESLMGLWSDGQQDYGSAIYEEQLNDLLIETLPYAEKVKAKKQRSKDYIGF
jgi:hypothetical protein